MSFPGFNSWCVCCVCYKVINRRNSLRTSMPCNDDYMNKRTSPALILTALWLMVFAASSQVMIIAPILPVIGRELHVPEAWLGTLISAYSITLSFFALIAGPLSDRIGRRRMLLYGAGFLALVLYFHALAQSFSSLLVMRALAGAAGGTLSGSAVAYIGDYFPYRKRGWATGWVMSGIAFGQIVGIPLGTILADTLGFRVPFLIFGVIMTLAFLLILCFVPQPRIHRSRDPFTLTELLRIYINLLHKVEIRAAIATYFLMFLSVGLFVSYFPKFLTDMAGFNGKEIAALFFIGGIANVIAGPQAGKFSDRWGRKPIILLSCIGSALTILALPLVAQHTWSLYTVFFIAMIFVGMRISPLQALLTALVPAQRRGTLLSFAIAAGQLGMGLGGSIAGWLYTRIGYLSNAALAAFFILLMAGIIWRYLPEPATL